MHTRETQCEAAGVEARTTLARRPRTGQEVDEERRMKDTRTEQYEYGVHGGKGLWSSVQQKGCWGIKSLISTEDPQFATMGGEFDWNDNGLPGCHKMTPWSPNAHFRWSAALNRDHNSTRPPERRKE